MVTLHQPSAQLFTWTRTSASNVAIKRAVGLGLIRSRILSFVYAVVPGGAACSAAVGMLKINPMITERRRLRSRFIGSNPPIKNLSKGGNVPRCVDYVIPDTRSVSNIKSSRQGQKHDLTRTRAKLAARTETLKRDSPVSSRMMPVRRGAFPLRREYFSQFAIATKSSFRFFCQHVSSCSLQLDFSLP